MISWRTASESPSPSPDSSGGPDSDEIAETATEVAQDVLSTDWWLSEALPVVLRIAVILIAGFVIRHILVKIVNRAVLQTAKSRTKKIDHLDDDQVETAIDHKRDIVRAETIGKLFTNIVSIVVFTFVALLIFSELGFDIGPLIAGAGFLGVALGFGAQSLVADFMNGVFMMMEDQYAVGDVVRVTGESGTDSTGTVERVNLRTTEIRAIDGTLWFVRNGEIYSAGNMSQDWSRGVLDIGISYQADVARAKQVLASVGEEFAADQEFGSLVLKTPEVWGVQELGQDSVILRLVIKTRPGDHWVVSRQLLERIKYAFDEEGIQIPFPQRTVWLRQEPRDDGLEDPDEEAIAASVFDKDVGKLPDDESVDEGDSQSQSNS